MHDRIIYKIALYFDTRKLLTHWLQAGLLKEVFKSYLFFLNY